MDQRKALVRGGLSLAALALLFVTGADVGSVFADTTTSFSLSVSDCQTATEICAVVPFVTVQTASVLLVDFIASSGHCSNIIAHIQIDGVEKFVSGSLAPGASTGLQNLGPVSAGSHTVGVEAEGVVGGCNIGFIASWGGTLDVTTSVASSAAVPTLSQWAEYLLVALLIGAGLLALRRRRGGSVRRSI